MFDVNFAPKFNEVWYKLDIFDCDDFWIDPELEGIFRSSNFSNLDFIITVKESHVVTYGKRTLEDARCIECIILN
jgi:hypothetical protein